MIGLPLGRQYHRFAHEPDDQLPGVYPSFRMPQASLTWRGRRGDGQVEQLCLRPQRVLPDAGVYCLLALIQPQLPTVRSSRRSLNLSIILPFRARRLRRYQ